MTLRLWRVSRVQLPLPDQAERPKVPFVNWKPNLKRPAHLAITTLAVLIATADLAGATDRRGERAIEAIETRTAGEPVLAVVSLNTQRITVYDANGWILRAPVSSGTRGRETPAGIFSVIQKDAEHYSNLYDDAFMPHMQRITWSGIALHGGPLPGYAASHGCVRMPFDFAARLFDLTQLGLRVIIAPTDVTPIEMTDPGLFPPKPGATVEALARNAEAEEAAKKADQARHASVTAFRESAQARVALRTAENLKVRAEMQLSAADTALASASSTEAQAQAEAAKAEAVARIAELVVQADAAKAELQPKLDAVTAAREAAVAAEAQRVAAVELAQLVSGQLAPVSVLISRKTQRLYVRRVFEPVFEGPVTIADPDRPIGTHVFTALERATGDNMRWSVVSLESGRPQAAAPEPPGRTRTVTGRKVEPGKTNPEGARAVLNRIVIPQETLDRIVGFGPRSSVIVTDEALSSETGKGTDFVVVLSDEPQGGIKSRRRPPAQEFGDARDGLPFSRSPFATPRTSRF